MPALARRAPQRPFFLLIDANDDMRRVSCIDGREAALDRLLADLWSSEDVTEVHYIDYGSTPVRGSRGCLSGTEGDCFDITEFVAACLADMSREKREAPRHGVCELLDAQGVDYFTGGSAPADAHYWREAV